MTESVGDESYTEEEWDTALERLGAIRERMISDPVAAGAEARKYAEITKRVQTPRTIRKARGLDPAADLRSTTDQPGRGVSYGASEQSAPRNLGPFHRGHRRQAADHRSIRRLRDRDRDWRHPPDRCRRDLILIRL